MPQRRTPLHPHREDDEANRRGAQYYLPQGQIARLGDVRMREDCIRADDTRGTAPTDSPWEGEQVNDSRHLHTVVRIISSSSMPTRLGSATLRSPFRP